MYKHSKSVPVTALRPSPARQTGNLDRERPVTPILRLPSIPDLLRYLIIQILWYTKAVHSESSLSWICNQYRGATSEEELWNILGQVISFMSQNITFIIDAELLGPVPRGDHGSFGRSETAGQFCCGFYQMIRNLSGRNVGFQVMVMLIAHDVSHNGYWGPGRSGCHCESCQRIHNDQISRAEYERTKQFNDSAYTDLLSPLDPNIFAL